MSLFSHEEICRGCTYAVFHKCCRSFCKCTHPDGDATDNLKGKCENKLCKHEYESDGGNCIHCGQQGGLLERTTEKEFE